MYSFVSRMSRCLLHGKETVEKPVYEMGTHPGVAIPMSLSRKGPWRCARTRATQTGMIPISSGLNDQGLLSVKELWVSTCPPQEDSLPNRGPAISVNRPVRLSASGGDPHAGWCGGWGLITPGYPIMRPDRVVSYLAEIRSHFSPTLALTIPIDFGRKNSYNT
jgi:hypothetical protein